MYLKDITHHCLCSPKPRTTHRGQQGVMICDCVGTHLGYVVHKSLDLGMEILVRVPDFSFALHGEDTVNFKELKYNWRKTNTRCSMRLT
jgi:hypothetical protein